MGGAYEQFCELYEDAYPAVLRYACRRVDPDVAPDVASEVFVIVWRRWADVPSANALPWLYGVARKVVANQRRSAVRKVRLAERVAASQQTRTAAPDPADAVVAGLAITAAFEQLSDDDREVLALVVWEGLGARDVAQVLGCSVAATAARVSRARRRFRANLALHEKED